MTALVIKSFPEALHNRLRQAAALHRRSVTQETIHLIEQALSAESAKNQSSTKASYWTSPNVLPQYQELLNSGKITSDVDSATGLSAERDAR